MGGREAVSGGDETKSGDTQRRLSARIVMAGAEPKGYFMHNVDLAIWLSSSSSSLPCF